MSHVPLPPLPPLPGAAGTEARPGGRGMLDILADEHRQLADLAARLTRAGEPSTVSDPALGALVVGRHPGRTSKALTSVLAATLARHLSAEEQYLYPTVRAMLPDGGELADAEIVADAALQHALRRLESGPASDLSGLDEVVRVLGEHVERCARLFPRLRAALDEATLIRLGNRVVIAEDAAPTRPHPGTPFTPPWNRLVEPVVGVVDKVRDVATGRATRAESLGSDAGAGT
jgi:hypothetical protein